MIKLIFLLVALPSLQALATPFTGAVSSSTAGTGRASVEATDTPFLNPAIIPFVRGYIFTTSFSAVSNSSAAQESDVALSLTDNMKDTVVPTNISYIQGGQTRADESRIVSKDFRLAFGERVLPKLSFGLAGHYRNDKSDFDSYGQTNLTLATAVGLTENLAFGFVYEDFIPPPAAVPEDLKLQAITSMGLSHNYKKVIRTKLDLISGKRNNFGKATLAGGLETYMNKWLILRIGLGYNQELKSSILAAGLGFQGPKFGLHYGYQNSREDQNSTRHSVDLAIPIW